MTRVSLSIVIPAFNEKDNILRVYEDIQESLKEVGVSFDILFVDDGSVDGTLGVLKKLRDKKKINLVIHKKNKGFSGALRSCFENAKGDYLLLAPADGQFSFGQTQKFIKYINKCDVVMAYRTRKDESLFRKLESLSFHFIYRFLFGIKLKEISSVSMWKRDFIKNIKVDAEDGGATYLPELVYRCWKKKAKFKEVPIIWKKRFSGKAKGANFRMIFKTLIGILKLRLQAL